MAQTILIVEDEAPIRDFLQDILEDAGYQTVTAQDGMEGIVQIQQTPFDLILLDVLMPKIDGFAVLEMIRRQSDVPVIFLTALGAEVDQLRGFDLEADDYIVKPSTAALILRRVEAALRRSNQRQTSAPADGRILTSGGLRLDTERYTVSIDGQEISLTLKEFALLRLLMEGRGRVLTREMLLDQVWGIDYYGDDKLVNVHMAHLRKKLGGAYIETVRGVGYRFSETN